MATYRSDIDGLRALAVVPVVAFHGGLAGFGGGFTGVDVFFVISGYLLTGILMREMDEDRYTLTGFYVRRVRRILPAVTVVVLSIPSARPARPAFRKKRLWLTRRTAAPR